MLPCSLQPRAAPWKAGNAGPLLLSPRTTRGPRGGHTQGSSPEGLRGVSCSCGRRGGRWDRRPRVAAGKDTHEPATLPGRVATGGALLEGLGPLQARPPHQGLRGARPSLAGWGPVCCTLPSPTPLLWDRPPAPSTAAVQTCVWWRWARARLAQRRPSGVGAPGPPPPRPLLPLGGLARKAQVPRGAPSRSKGAGAVCCCGKGVSGFAGTRGGLGTRGRPLLRCSEPHGERPLGRVGPQMHTAPRVVEAARSPKSNTAARRQPSSKPCRSLVTESPF